MNSARTGSRLSGTLSTFPKELLPGHSTRIVKTAPSLTGAAARLWKWTACGEETTMTLCISRLKIQCARGRRKRLVTSPCWTRSKTSRRKREFFPRKREIPPCTTRSRRLNRWEQVLRNHGRLRPGSRAARTPRKRTLAGAGTLLRFMKHLEDAIKGVSSRASEALGESEETSCWHPAIPAVTDDAGRSFITHGAGKQSCTHDGGLGS